MKHGPLPQGNGNPRRPPVGEEAARPAAVARPSPGWIVRKAIVRFNGPMKKGLLALCTLAAVLSAAAASIDETLERVVALANEARIAEARKVLDPLLARDADHPRLRLLDGVLRAQEGRAREAIEVFDRLRRDHPEMSEPWNNLAVLYAAEGRIDEAREALLAALERRPSALGYANLGEIHAKLARRAWRRARELAAEGKAGQGPEGAGGPAVPPPQVSPEGPMSGGLAALPADASPARAPDDSRAAHPACLRGGGIEDRRVLAGVEEWLESRGAEVFALRRERHRNPGHFQVYLPPLADREAAAAKAREIRARGVRDIDVIRTGLHENGISFGVYRVEENTRRRVASLEQLGYPVRTRKTGKVVHRYFLEARSTAHPDALRADWEKRFPDWPLESVDCS